MTNAEVVVEFGGQTLKYSVTPDERIYEIRKSGWRLVKNERIRKAILQRLYERQFN